MRAYEWRQLDGAASELPFVLCELWGRPQHIIRAVLEVTTKDAISEAKMLVPETRLWKINLQHLKQRCPDVEMSQDVAIADPMRCHSVAMKGARNEVGPALQALIMQVCD